MLYLKLYLSLKKSPTEITNILPILSQVYENKCYYRVIIRVFGAYFNSRLQPGTFNGWLKFFWIELMTNVKRLSLNVIKILKNFKQNIKKYVALIV